MNTNKQVPLHESLNEIAAEVNDLKEMIHGAQEHLSNTIGEFSADARERGATLRTKEELARTANEALTNVLRRLLALANETKTKGL